MTNRLTIISALIVLLTTAGCGAGAGYHPLPPPAGAVQPQNAGAAAESALREDSSHHTATPVPLATGLVDPTELKLHGHDLFIGDVGAVDRVHRAGGPLHIVLTGTSIFDSGSARGVNRMAFFGPTIIAGYGGYVEYKIVQAPIATGVQTLLATPQAGYFIGVVGGNVYYGSGFSTIDKLPLTGGPAQTVLSGVWVRRSESDDAALYFVDYWTRNVYRFDVSTQALAPLITGNSVEGAIAIDRLNLYFSAGATIQKVSKRGGPAAVIYAGTEPQVLAADDDDVFFAEAHDIKAMPKTGGPVRTIASGMVVAVAVADERYLYFTDVSHGVGSSVVYRVRTGR